VLPQRGFEHLPDLTPRELVTQEMQSALFTAKRKKIPDTKRIGLPILPKKKYKKACKQRVRMPAELLL